MTIFVCDVEADGPVPGKYSMLSMGFVALTPELNKTFYRELKPISDEFDPEALAISGLDRDRLTRKGRLPNNAMIELSGWVKSVSKGRPIFISDNPGFDFAFVNYYFHVESAVENPFGWSSRRIGDLYCGMQMDTFARWKQLRKTTHTHNALDDAMGNAEALLEMKKMGLKISTK